jgi:hypothetical protein
VATSCTKNGRSSDFLSSGELARLGAALVALELGGLPDEYSDINQVDSVAPLSDAKKKGRKDQSKVAPLWKNPTVAAVKFRPDLKHHNPHTGFGPGIGAACGIRIAHDTSP